MNNQKYIFVTGGVVSGIGKGICAAAIGNILKSSGLEIDALKMDPYLNVDPGTMSPYEHGEVYVLSDGKETDLDLGNYERFLNTNLDYNSSTSSGVIYSEIIKQEREGTFLGKTVQIIPHVTDHIKKKFEYQKPTTDIKIIEIGGSTGDIEAQVFLESLRQFKIQNPSDVLHVHLGYIPYLAAVGEFKSKPMQNSIKELLGMGLQPDLVVLRYEQKGEIDLPQILIDKIALYCNVSSQSVIKMPDLKSIYSSPRHLIDNTPILSRLNKFVGKELQPKLTSFFCKAMDIEEKTLNIALIAKYSGLTDSYSSVIESVKIAAKFNKCNANIQIIDSESKDLIEQLNNFDGFIVPGGFGKRGLEQKIEAIKWIRQNKKPFLGICLGLQMAVIEYCRNVVEIKNATSREMIEDESGLELVIDYMPDQVNQKIMGGTMRLGTYECEVVSGTLAHKQFQSLSIKERHRHRLEVQNQYISRLEASGMKVSGKHNVENTYLVEIVELDTNIHPYFIAIQSHPEFLSRPDNPHPLFDGLIKSCIK
jgi:CTP synthase